MNHRQREHGRSRYGIERYLRGFLDLLTVSFMGRYRHRPLHLFGGLGLLLGAGGIAVLVYLTVVKIGGHAIGQRPLLTLGVLLVVSAIAATWTDATLPDTALASRLRLIEEPVSAAVIASLAAWLAFRGAIIGNGR